jgi:hypothetical protein
MKIAASHFWNFVMALLGRIKSVFDKMKYLWSRLSQRVEGNLAKSEEIVDFSELERTRKKLVQMRSKNMGVESTGAFAMESVRRRMTAEISIGNAELVTTRKKTQEAMNKWFFKDDQTDTGSFNAMAFESRIKEVFCDTVERPLEPLPDVEDTFMAFSKDEYDLFDSNQSSLSGVHFKVDPFEDFDETYSTPLLSMSTEGDMNFNPAVNSSVMPSDQDDTIPPDEHDDVPAINFSVNNPMIKVLSELEERMGANGQRRDAFWVAE